MRTAMAFLGGFVAGMLFLGVLQWTSGSLQTVRSAGIAPLGSDRKSTDAAPFSDTAIPDLLFPVAGADASKIRDTFADVRGRGRHEATDIMAPRGSAVLAVDDGTVAKLFLSRAGGITIYQFDPTATWCYYYAHLDRYAPGLAEKSAVRKGQVIGYVGSTGDASAEAPHLHFSIFRLGPEKHWWQGTPINPYPILLRSARK